MTQKDKNLLLTDLCARLLYGVAAYASEINKNGIITDVNIPHNMVNLTVDNTNGRYELVPLLDIKPYLRPMSSMTEDERFEFENLWNEGFSRAMDEMIFGDIGVSNLEIIAASDAIDWLNAHHFDYRGLIERGLAIEAPEGMYN